jgi:hypothetical protein
VVPAVVEVVGVVDVSVTCSADCATVTKAVTTTAVGELSNEVVVAGAGHPWMVKFANSEHANESLASSVVDTGVSVVEKVVGIVKVEFGSKDCWVNVKSVVVGLAPVVVGGSEIAVSLDALLLASNVTVTKMAPKSEAEDGVAVTDD